MFLYLLNGYHLLFTVVVWDKLNIYVDRFTRLKTLSNRYYTMLFQIGFIKIFP
jgi:hypothetical protein